MQPGSPKISRGSHEQQPSKASANTALLLSRSQLTRLARFSVLRRLRVAICLSSVVILGAGCRDSLIALGGAGPAAASRLRAEQALAALGARVTEPLRDQKYDAARTSIATAALIPSRIWNDTSVWTQSTPRRRTLLVAGRFQAGRYRLDAARAVALPAQPADSRHVISLTRMSEDDFAWDTDVAYALGSIAATDVSTFFRVLLTEARGRSERELRADYRTALPQGAKTLGELFRVDSIKTAHLADSTTLATYWLTLTPEGVERTYPEFAKYMRNYVETAKMRWTITDRSGVMFLDFTLRDGRAQFRVRSRRGALVAIAGEATAMPDSLTLHGDMTMKVRMFTAGFRDYQSDFVLTNTPRETAFAITSRREPDWVLPLGAERLLRTPLRRPFQGSGATFSLGVRDSAEAQTILSRRMHIAVKESAILRFIGRLSSIAVSDFSGKAEEQQMAWLRKVFTALVADVRGLNF